MDEHMDVLQIRAVIKSVKALPSHDMQIDISQDLVCFIDSEMPVEHEVGGLERFRRAVMALVVNDLKHGVHPRCSDRTESPFATLNLEASDFADGSTLYKSSIRVDLWDSPRYWLARWEDCRGFHGKCPFFDLKETVVLTRAFLERETARWFSLIEFQRARAG